MFFWKKASTNGGGNFHIQNIYTSGLGGILVRIASGLLIVYLLWTGWTQFGPQKPRADAIRTAAATVAADRIGDVLRENRQSIKSLTLLNFADEPTNLISDGLRQHLGSAGTFLLKDRSFFDKIRLWLNIPQSATAEPEAALSRGKKNKTDGVLYGTVHQFESVKGRAMVYLDYHLVDCQTGEIIFSGTYDNRKETPSSTVVASLAIPAVVSDIASAVPTSGSGLLRFLGWLLIVLLLPVFTINFLVVMTEKCSNAVNAFVLGTYTLIGAILAWILIAPNAESYASLALFGLLCFGVFWYNVQLMSFAVRQNEA